MRKRTCHSNYRRIQILYRSASWQKKEVWLNKVSKYAVCGLWRINFDLLESLHKNQNRAVGARGARILSDQLNLFKPGEGHIMPTTLLLPPPDFQNFLRPCKVTREQTKTAKFVSKYLLTKMHFQMPRNNSKTLYILDTRFKSFTK